MQDDPAGTWPEITPGDDRVEVLLSVVHGVVDADVDPIRITHGQTVRWVIRGEDAGRITLRFAGRGAQGEGAAIRLVDADLGPFAEAGRPGPDALERSGAGGFVLHLRYGLEIEGQDLPWADHPVTGQPRNGGGLDVEVPPPGG